MSDRMWPRPWRNRLGFAAAYMVIFIVLYGFVSGGDWVKGLLWALVWLGIYLALLACYAIWTRRSQC